MKNIVLPNTGLGVSAISYGTAELGVNMTDAQVAALLNAYRDAGGNFIDTAHVYAFWTPAGAGSSETSIARYLKANRWDDVVIATKGGHPGLAGYRRTDDWLDPARVHADIEDSLGRLNVERIDLYYLHRDDLARTVGEIVEMLNAEVKSGTIRALGASNWSAARLEEAQEYAAAHGLVGFAASEIEFSMAYKEPAPAKPRGDQTLCAQSEDLEFHRRSGLPLCAYASTARGYFSDIAREMRGYDSKVSRKRRERAYDMAGQKGCTPTQIALAWLMHQPFPCIPITGTTNVEHLVENLGASDVSLSDDEMRVLTQG